MTRYGNLRFANWLAKWATSMHPVLWKLQECWPHLAWPLAWLLAWPKVGSLDLPLRSPDLPVMIVPFLVQGNPGASTFKLLCKITKLLEEDPWIQKIKGNLQLSQCSPSDASIVWRLGCYNTNARSHAQNMPHFARQFFRKLPRHLPDWVSKFKVQRFKGLCVFCAFSYPFILEVWDVSGNLSPFCWCRGM